VTTAIISQLPTTYTTATPRNRGSLCFLDEPPINHVVYVLGQWLIRIRITQRCYCTLSCSGVDLSSCKEGLFLEYSLHSILWFSDILSLSLSVLMAIFQGEPGLFGFIAAKDDGSAGNTTGAIRRAKLQSNSHHQQTNTQLFTGRMAFLSLNQRCHSTEGKPRAGSGVVRIDLLHFLAGCRTRRLNQV